MEKKSSKTAEAPLWLALGMLAWVFGSPTAWASGEAQAKVENKISAETKAKGPRVVVHPLTSSEILDQKDAEAFESLMEGARVFAKADPALAEQRAQAMLQEGKGAKTE